VNGYLTSSDPRPHFGLGQATQAERVEILWPGGKTQRPQNVAANQILTSNQPRPDPAMNPLVSPPASPTLRLGLTCCPPTVAPQARHQRTRLHRLPSLRRLPRRSRMGHQFSKWRLSAHAKAYTSLALPESKEITRLSGLTRGTSPIPHVPRLPRHRRRSRRSGSATPASTSRTASNAKPATARAANTPPRKSCATATRPCSTA
jgi:hypothetical protein